jgi:hypothetical protein
MIAVTFQHPCPYYDDSYVVNSPNTGPYDDAIMTELIPRVEEEFRIIREPYARVLSGGSTGGWISLAMQVFHPDFFGRAIVLCPDPVDFRYLQLVNIYEDKNAYYTDHGWFKNQRANQRSTDGRIVWMMHNENLFFHVVGNHNRAGGQWDIYDAAYGPVGENGYPKPLWNKRTGEIDSEVAEEWKNYDLRIYLEKNWPEIGPELVGKIHIYVGTMDNWYLNNAVKLLEDFLKETKNPHFGGTVNFADREGHNLKGPRGRELIELIAELVAENSPDPDEPKKWKY